MTNKQMKTIQFPNSQDVYEIVDEKARKELAKKQTTLESGTNIKTINGESILGGGDIPIQGGASPEQLQQIETNKTDITNLKTNKQNKLKQGVGIKLDPDGTISATGGGASGGGVSQEYVDNQLLKKQDKLINGSVKPQMTNFMEIQSKNLFNINNLTNTAYIIKEGNGIKVFSYGTETKETLKELCPGAKVGDTIYLKFTKSTESQPGFIKIGADSRNAYRNGSFTIQEGDLEAKILLYKDTSQEYSILGDIIMSTEDILFEPYNEVAILDSNVVQLNSKDPIFSSIELSEGTDIDSITPRNYPNNFKFKLTKALNGPKNVASSTGILDIKILDNTFFIQNLYISLPNYKYQNYQRLGYSTSSNWGIISFMDWETIGKSSSTEDRSDGTMPIYQLDKTQEGKSIDVDKIYNTGSYGINTALHAPTSWGSLLVLNYGKAFGNTKPNYATQVWFPTGDKTSKVYYRLSDANNWKTWKTITTSEGNAEFFELNKADVKYQGIDPDTVYDAGIYGVNGFLNVPYGVVYGQLMVIPYGNPKGNTKPNSAFQLLFPTADKGGGSSGKNTFYYRNSLSGSWNNWKAVGAGGDVNVWTSGDISYNIKIEEKMNEFLSVIGDSNKTDSFVFFTDPHAYLKNKPIDPDELKLNMTTIQKFYNNGIFNFVLCGGDWLNQGHTIVEANQALNEIYGFCKTLFKPFYIMIGNHDTNYQGEGQLSTNKMSTLWFNGRGKTYYSFDTPSTKYYLLDTGLDGGYGAMNDYRWEQLNWLCDKLKADDAEFSVITQHIWTDDVKPMSKHSHSPMAEEEIKIITAYNNRTSISVNGVQYNFADCRGKIKYVLVGHSHFDSFDTINDSVPVIITTQLSNKENRCNFDLMHVDYDNDIIYCIRATKGTSRKFSMKTGKQL